MSFNERRIDLHTGVTRGMPDFTRGDAQGHRRDASDVDRQAFEQAMSRDEDTAPGEPDVPRPFALFGGAATPARSDTPPSGLAASLEQAAERLLVSDGSNGGRPEVRISLKDDVLPGVTVSIYEDEGRIVAAFVCANDESREKLNACSHTLAEDICRALGRAALVRVTTDDPDDPCLHEAAFAA